MNKQDQALEELKQAILRNRLKKRIEQRGDDLAATTIPLADRSAPLPLSWAQQRLWFLDRLDPAASAAYHMPVALRLSGRLDRDALKATLDRLIARHENLRTCFVEVDGVPTQVIGSAERGFALDEQDLGALAPDARETAIAELGATEARAPFDLAAGPLIRGRLLRLADDEHVLLLTQHHIVSDGWSIGVLVREVTALYSAFSQGQADPLPPLAIQYADYAVWQRQWLQGDALQGQLDFWRGHLGGAPALLELPSDRPRPPVQRYAGGRVDLRLTPQLTASLHALSQRHGTTMFMVLLAAWATLLSRLSGQDEVVIGSPVANRRRSEVEPLIGFFVNTIALRIDFSGKPDVAALLAQVKAATLGAYAHQDVPFEQVVEALQPARSLSYGPVFQTMLAFNNTPGNSELSLPGLSLEMLGTSRYTAHFDLELGLREIDGAVEGNIGYASDLFDHATIERYADYFVSVLEGLAAEGAEPIARLPLMAAAERQRVLEGFNDSAVEFPPQRVLHQLFEQQVQRTPDASALVFEESRLGYAELNRRANRVAHRLIALGVKPDDRVAICAERGPELVVGVLGILKAGAGYVPLDPAYPDERLAYMLGDSAPLALLSQHSLLAEVPALAASRVPLIDLDDAALAAEPEHDPLVAGLTPDHLAYVIYTSGSTGQPKGVAMPQAPLVNLIDWQCRDQAGRAAGEKVLQFSALGFDVAFQELFYTLASGGCLMLLREATRQDPFALVEFIKRHEVQRIFLPFVAFQGLVAAAERNGETLPSLTRVVTAGEQLFVNPAIRSFFARVPGRELHNHYGPTESHVCTAHTLAGDPMTWPATPPIGAPIANARIYLLDGERQPVPPGVNGEIYIGGACLARGYLGRPELSAERFLADPFVADADARMYKTGDLGRWLPDGTVDYLGRNDFQVKIRGFRVELGEIEARLCACAGVREAVVTARDDQAGGKRLVAYLLAEQGADVSAATLRAALARDLAEYMLPSAFVSLDAWPMSPNGKLDRRALPAPDQSALALREYEAPQGELEQTVARVWCELLGLERAGRQDQFFELGGHSLLAVQLVTRLREALGVELALREVFAHPSLAAMAAALAGAGRADDSAIAVADRNGPLPLSWAQQRLWFLDQLDRAASAAYHMPAALRLSGTLDRGALKRTLDGIVARHENLRTSFVDGGGTPVQVIAPAEVGFALIEHDLSGVAADARDAAVAALAAQEAQAPFDLAVGPLIRGRLLRLAEDEHVLLVTQHHIVSDGWSLGVLVREVSALYAAFHQGRSDPLPPLPIQYVDYALWQRQWLQGETLQAQLDFWREHLRGAPALLELPADRPRPPLQSYAGDRVALSLSPALTASLRALSQRHGTTLFMTLLAAWSVLLSRLSGQDQVVIGSPVANRQRAEVEPLIGFFVNTLALRVDLSAAPSVAALLAQIKATTLDAYAHQDVPFEQVVEAVQPARTLSYSPLFQSMLAFNNTPDGGALELPGLSLEAVGGTRHTAHFDIELAVTDAGATLEGNLAFATDLFERATIERYAGHFVRLLEGMAGDDARSVDALPLLSAAEREQVLRGFNATDAEYPHDCCIHGVFEQRAAERPTAIAARFQGRSLTYAELDRSANRLAHRLIALGVQPDDRVAICAERGLELVVGLLAILKAGAGYVPLDPQHPDERLAFMLADSAPRVLLAPAALRESVAALAQAEAAFVAMDGIADVQSPSPLDLAPEVAGLGPRHLAYVIYTSGSTGLPKGVMVEHRNVLRLVVNNECAQFGVDDVIGLCANPAFDASTWELWGALLNGARLEIIAAADVLEPARFAAALIDGGVTALWLTVGLFNEYVDALAPAFAGLNHLLIGGDALDPRSVARALGRAQRPRRLVNGYGPTETTTFATNFEIAAVAEGARSIPIGKPIANTRVYLLDARGEPVPVGVAGELYIGGPGVARGYLNRDELSAERFVADPFGDEPGARLYRTGDLGRWQADGSIEFLGRNDFQVKIRGFRIELGEIEARLTDCAGVREAVVLAREDQPGDKRLVAYVIADDGAEVSAAALREALAKHLADYMLPSAFVSLAAWPLTANGKLDRKALPAPDASAVAAREYEAPQGEAETAVAAIWCELLGLERVGRHDHFFELGGHSLLAVQLTTRLRESLGAALALREVFARPTLAAMASALSGAERTDEAAIPRADRAAALPLSWAQQRLWFLDRLDPAAGAAYHMPTALRLSGRLDRDALKATLDRIVARHENLRTCFVEIDGAASQSIAPADRGFDLVEIDLRELDADARERAVAELGAEEARTPFDLAAGPLIRGRLLRLAADEHVLLLTQHHIVSDGWSLGVLVKEVTALYTAFSQGQDDPLPPLPIQYADYAQWQRQWLQGETLRQQLGFWREHLHGAPALLELPTDRPRPPLQSYAGDRVGLSLSPRLTADLRELSQRHGATLFMTLLAAWSSLLSRLSGQGEIVVGSPVANRQRAEIEPLIGFFVNTLALRIEVDGQASVADLLGRVRSTMLDAYAHQDVPFEQVVEAVQPARSLSYSPLFQTMFAFNNTPGGGALQLPGLELESIGRPLHTAHFDLELALADSGDSLQGNLSFASDLFERETIERYAGYFVSLLEAMVADAQCPVARLPLLSVAERERVLEDFNDTGFDYPRERLLHQPFEAQVRATPDATAVVCGDQRLSYAELNRRANRIAHRLLALGVRADDRVAICLERGPSLVAGVLGILKAGAAYVPLDPNYPPDRLAYMLADSAPMALLSQTSLSGLLGEVEVSVLSADDAALADQPEHDPVVDGLTARHLAYVIYTSGSTGQPKGVAIEHANAANFVAWANANFSAEQLRDTLFSTSINFDLAVYELFAPLSIGATITVVRDVLATDPASPLSLINTVPSGINALLQSGGVPATVRTVNLAGEPLKRALVEQIFARTEVAMVANLYGPTETTTYSTWVAMDRADGFASHIGKPVANTRIYIVDAHLEPVPVGVVGELYIGGEGVARGYLHRPELTAERFVNDPFVADKTARMYKTGDLGRWRADGTIEYLGRNDFQVKIRGFRIELGEIETKLAACDGVREAVVVAREGEGGDKRLIAYVVPQDGIELSTARLREQLSRSLAEFMLPSAFVTLAALPLTPNGKLDRKALPAPGDDAVIRREFEAPQGEVETALAQIWCELLGLERVGRHDQFFELGGHSLLALQLVTRLRSTLGLEFALREVFAQPSLEGMARALDRIDRAAESLAPIAVADRNGPLPLSWAQQRLWFLDQLDPAAGAAYHMPAALRLSGSLDRDALKAALDRVVARHENLRTCFAEVDGEPVQLIAAADAGFALIEHDLRELDETACEHALAGLSLQEARAPFDLARGPLIRGRLLRLREDEHVLLVTQHHIVSDGWSIGVLVREVAALYAACHEGRTDPLPPLPIQYADYALWQRQWLQGETLREQVEFWRGHLQGAPALLELPSDRPRPPVQSYAGDRVELRLSSQASAALRALSQRHGTTVFMTLLAGWASLLSRLSGQDEVVIGSPVANRQRTEIEPLIGFFVNTLALRIGVDGRASVAELLAQVKATMLDVYAHQELPFEQVVEAVQPARSLSYGPLFQTMFAFNNTPGGGALSLPGLALESIDSPLTTTQFDLSLALADGADGIAGSLAYATALFDRATAERYAACLVSLLEAMAADERCAIAALPLLGAPQREQVLRSFNDTEASFDLPASIHRGFELQTQRTPEAEALVCGERSLSYAELNRRANRIAHRLIALGVRADDRVAIRVERELETIVGVLGILKAGAGYVPLDPAYPSERLDYMLADSAPVALLTTSTASPLTTTLPVIALDDAALTEQPEHDPELTAIGPQQLAYAIYTSGSTGRPKGVMVEHRNVLNLWAALEREAFVHCAPGARVALNAGLSFDASLQALTQLLSGRSVVLVPAEVRADAEAMLDFLVRERIQAFDCTPAQFELLIERGLLRRDGTDLRMVLIGGEALSARAWDAAAASSLRCFNVYGPTECTVDATLAPIRAGVGPHIGTPIANTQLYILDGERQPVPVGVTGEIHIGGAGVARGYLHRAELTDERFLTDPFADAEGARMYRTGDLGRWLEDGRIEYLGRNDFQVKIRGHRIELGEIEARLGECDGVREAVVVAREDQAGDQRLVAYLLARGDAAPSAAALRERLARSLAEHMLPTAFVVLPRWPLTANGKLDRAALPAPDGAARVQHAYVEPQGATEAVIAEVWSQLLGVERVGRHDRFFELGGHSLLAIRVVHELRARLGVAVPLSATFSAPTLAALAAAIDEQDVRPASLCVPLQAAATGRPMFCVHPVGGQVSFYAALAARLAVLGPVYGLQSPEAAGLPQRPASLQAMAQAQVEAIRTVQPQGPYRLLGWSSGGILAATIAQQLLAAGERVEYLGLLDTHLPIAGLDKDPMRAAEVALRAELQGRGLAWPRSVEFDGLAIEVLSAQRFEQVESLLQRLGWRDADAAAFAHLQAQWPVTRAHLQLLSGYKAGRIDAPVQAFRADSSDRVAEGIEAISGGFEATAVDAGHYAMLAEPHAQRIAAAIAEFLAHPSSTRTSRIGADAERALAETLT
ncbi:amino acid adenylation domain-containing protein [Lysobacter sp. Hz 25]|uniref:non-ribosomal peptide synthetase n=1 Tax=Lysobacter sp. Hz 25 TaxID=3383698 RepID=UPI0038D3A116